MVVVVDIHAAEVPIVEVVAKGMAVEMLSCCSFYFRSDSISSSIL